MAGSCRNRSPVALAPDPHDVARLRLRRSAPCGGKRGGLRRAECNWTKRRGRHDLRNRSCDLLRALVFRCCEEAVQTGTHRNRSEEHTSELQSLMRISYAVFCLKKKITSDHTEQFTQLIHNNIEMHISTQRADILNKLVYIHIH